MNRPRFRRIASALATLGLVAAPAAVSPVAQSQQVVQQQGSSKEQVTAPVAQVPQAQVSLDLRAFRGYGSRHPVWMGRPKRGKGRKSGTRSRWDYQR